MKGSDLNNSIFRYWYPHRFIGLVTNLLISIVHGIATLVNTTGVRSLSSTFSIHLYISHWSIRKSWYKAIFGAYLNLFSFETWRCRALYSRLLRSLESKRRSTSLHIYLSRLLWRRVMMIFIYINKILFILFNWVFLYAAWRVIGAFIGILWDVSIGRRFLGWILDSWSET